MALQIAVRLQDCHCSEITGLQPMEIKQFFEGWSWKTDGGTFRRSENDEDRITVAALLAGL